MLLVTHHPEIPAHREPWNKGKLVGPKPPFKLQEIWAIRIRLEIEHQTRELALFNLAIDSKLRGCDLVRLKVSDVMHGRHAVSRAMVVQHKTQQPVRFELTEQTRDAVENWIDKAALVPDNYLFPSRVSGSPHLSTRLVFSVSADRIVNSLVTFSAVAFLAALFLKRGQGIAIKLFAKKRYISRRLVRRGSRSGYILVRIAWVLLRRGCKFATVAA
jgi:hypothetical protein